MKDIDIREFIEKLIINIPSKDIWIDDEIKKLDKSIDYNLVRQKLFDWNLLKEQSEIYDRL